MLQNVDKKREEKKEQSLVVSWENFSYQARLYYSKTPLPTSAELKFRSHSKTKQSIKMYKLLEINFLQLLFLVGLCLVLFKWARNRDVAGIKVNQI